ncbi:MAG: fibrobacter succinogenes major paralogous domain-containing protein [Chitinispirillia bacterium]|nr:fibrobacter succinogenes major paralogous domain-containing protein [Chitinispirillia bacterium]MCL2269075.1 fibrobacter succinogenes major paralogous domain-containing protein [Chitinispirillia bacterium]
MKRILTVMLAALCTLAAAQEPGGTFTDQRDEKTYRTVKIGERVWMAENLDFDTVGSWCYNNTESNCKRSGRLYDWNTAMAACPAGWRLPSRAEWGDLVKAVGDSAVGKALKSKTLWNGTDEFGFTALPGGHRFKTGRFYSLGEEGLWWSSTATGGRNAWYRNLRTDSENLLENHIRRVEGLAVRCVKN